MPYADGFIKSTARGRFIASFLIDDIKYNCAGSFVSAVDIRRFTCNTAVLFYPDLESITATRALRGLVGPSLVTLNLANGPAINGALDMPIFPGSTVLGECVWTQN